MFEIFSEEENDEESEVFSEHAIIGQVDIVDMLQNVKDPYADKGCFNWKLENPVMFEKPILNVKGQQRLWNYEI